MGNGNRTDQRERASQAHQNATARSILVPERYRCLTDVRLAARVAEDVVQIQNREDLLAVVVLLRELGVIR